MTFDEWWEQNYANEPTDGFSNRTFGEEVWNAAQEEYKNERLQCPELTTISDCNVCGGKVCGQTKEVMAQQNRFYQTGLCHMDRQQ